MTTAAHPDAAQLETVFQQAEQARMEAADAEHAAFVRWQETYGAYDVARDEASAAWTAWVEALVP
jgi:hypothetical protein